MSTPYQIIKRRRLRQLNAFNFIRIKLILKTQIKEIVTAHFCSNSNSKFKWMKIMWLLSMSSFQLLEQKSKESRTETSNTPNSFWSHEIDRPTWRFLQCIDSRIRKHHAHGCQPQRVFSFLVTSHVDHHNTLPEHRETSFAPICRIQFHLDPNQHLEYSNSNPKLQIQVH
jgi:hypothetical protein